MKTAQCRCHACGETAKLNDVVCGHCDAALTIICPACGSETFLSGNCRYCRTSLYVSCPNEDCRKVQLLSPYGFCRFCGAKISIALPNIV